MRFDLTDISAHSIQNKVAAVRELDLDVAIDLSGWTSGHFLGGFLARLAPVQCSYLGFFASTGIQEIDYWLGDWSLFPKDYSGWHTETLWRLDRPFLAWQPVDPLPEATADVTSAPVDRFVLVLSITTASFPIRPSGFGARFWSLFLNPPWS